ncbi:MAG: BlaR1 family beta-lactam sensor/signal transducer [Anaerobutyricum sp.]|nr:BlaR1 family beta-lactam sensor/signal transducer [Anaerobutyricum sp.]
MLSSFFLYFFICNLYISGIILLTLSIKALFRHHLSEKYQYRIWFPLFSALLIPFIPFRQTGFLQFISGLFAGTPSDSTASGQFSQSSDLSLVGSESIQDFSISISQKASSDISSFLAIVWVVGMIAVIIIVLKSAIYLYQIRKSSLPLENKTLQKLIRECETEQNIPKEIPVYVTAYLQSPALAGFLHPRIYLPLSLLSDYEDTDMRFILLHELQHYRQKDPLIKCLTCLFCIPYWFNPLVWYSFRVMHNDCEIACDFSVMNLLENDSHLAYGHTLLNFAEKMSFSPLTFASEMVGNHSQIRKRILHIAAFQRDTRKSRVKNSLIWVFTALLILESISFFPVHASEEISSLPKEGTIIYKNYASFFQGYEGSFVLYDMETNQWQIYNKELATQRVSPDSTYKIYSGLMALENHLISPEASEQTWDGQHYPFSQWNRDQTLTSALQNSVNWYFQSLDKEAGQNKLEAFYKKIGYGNQDLSGGTEQFWMEASLKISPVEQVELLKKLYTNEYHFQEENVQAILRGMRISDSASGTLYGKTGTGNINGENINGWFIGYVTGEEHTCCFAVNIHKPKSNSESVNAMNANGATASEIALHILKFHN